MSAAAAFARFLNHRYIFIGAMAGFSLTFSVAGSAEPITPGPGLNDMRAPTAASGGADNAPTVGELRSHAETIADILEVASERVDQLATTDAEKPALMEAIRHELSLSRRWNRHLGTILDEVAEARRALKTREREAAREIAHMTAVAEEARLELLTLKNVLTGGPGGDQGVDETWSEGSLDLRDEVSRGDQMAGDRGVEAPPIGISDGTGRDLLDARASLSSLQDAQKSAARDVAAVRNKIIEALETLADARGDLPMEALGVGADLSSEAITAWAASMATRLNRDAAEETD